MDGLLPHFPARCAIRAGLVQSVFGGMLTGIGRAAALGRIADGWRLLAPVGVGFRA